MPTNHSHSARVWLATTGIDPEMGGVASVARSCLSVLSNESPPSPIALEKLVCLNGRASESNVASDWKPVSCQGSRGKFLAQMLKQATSAPDLLIFDHLDLSQCQALIPSFFRRPYVVWAHGIEIWQPLPTMKRRGLLGAASLLFNSEFTHRKALSRHPWLEPANARIVPLCIEAEASPPNPGLEGPAKKPWILTVGRLENSRPKGHREILEILPELMETVPDLEWHVAGNGSWFSALEKLVSESEARDRIFLHGFATPEKLNALYQASRIFCMPSRDEGFGLVYAEAMQHGCVCVGSTVDAAPEVIGAAGDCIDPDDPRSLFETLMKYLAMSPEDFESVSRKARDRGEAFRPDRFGERFLAALQPALDSGRC